ncbi:MAG: hypothetical protein HY248_04830, partial [Fimbriimonas ginsengisoli]|nr:hypothetical protein [Fimbriimonas ginsengisoli]
MAILMSTRTLAISSLLTLVAAAPVCWAQAQQSDRVHDLMNQVQYHPQGRQTRPGAPNQKANELMRRTRYTPQTDNFQQWSRSGKNTYVTTNNVAARTQIVAPPTVVRAPRAIIKPDQFSPQMFPDRNRDRGHDRDRNFDHNFNRNTTQIT